MNLEFGINIYTGLYAKQINNKWRLYSTGNYIQHPIINHNRKEYEKTPCTFLALQHTRNLPLLCR